MIKNEKGITLVSLVITIMLMTIIASTVVYMSMDRFEVNNVRKMFNDIELLEDKVSNYYLKYGVLPILRDASNNPIEYSQALDFETNDLDGETYYIIDVKAMEGISLNYGQEGIENPNTSDDVYIVNEASHIIYYVKGIELDDVTYHTLTKNLVASSLEDVIPPSLPQIKVISGKLNNEGIYTSEVKLELIPGREDGNIAEQTEYSTDNGTNWTNIIELENSIYTIATTGNYSIKLRSYDKNNNISENSMDLSVEIIIRKTLEVASEGQSWLDLTRSYSGRASQFIIYGNSIQNGTPSPDTPVEVESVGEIVNLFPDDEWQVGKALSGYGPGYEVVTFNNNLSVSAVQLKLEPKNYYTLSINTDTYYIYRITEMNNENICLNNHAGYKWDLAKTCDVYTWVTDEATDYINIEVRRIDGNEITQGEISNIKLQLKKGVNTTDYVPYGKYGVPIKITTNTGNLVNKNNFRIGHYIYNYYVGKNLLGMSCIGLDVDPNTAYIFSINLDKYYVYRMIELSSDNTAVAQHYFHRNESDRVAQYTWVTKGSTDHISIEVRRVDGANITKQDIVDVKLQIEEGDTATEYTEYQGQEEMIYLDEPLRKVGDVADYIDFSTGKVVRKIKKINIDGTEVWGKNYNRDDYDTITVRLFQNSEEYKMPDYTVILSNQYEYLSALWNYTNSDKAWKIANYGNQFYVSINNAEAGITTEDTEDERTQKFVDYIKEHNFYVLYQLETPDDSETIELPNIKTFDDYTKIEVLTEVVPSAIYAEYAGYEIQ